MKKKKKIKASHLDTLRTIRGSRKRFIAIAVIAMLGVMMFSALSASTEDLRRASDAFYQKQNLQDLSVVSTLGLTKADQDALESLDDISAAEGMVQVHAILQKKKTTASVTIENVPEKIDLLYVKEGRLPERSGETVLTWKCAESTGLKPGDTVDLTEKDGSSKTASLRKKRFRVTGIVIDPAEINNPSGSMSYRMDNIADRAFVRKEDLQASAYARILLQVKGSRQKYSYGDAYEKSISDVRKEIEKRLKKERQDARTAQVQKQAEASFRQAQQEMRASLEQTQKQMEAAGMREDQIAAAMKAAREKAQKQLAGKTPEVSPAVWYLYDRTSLESYTDLKADADSIASIGNVFPLLFLAVAVLVSLTAVTRMIDEDRGLIGTYRSLGFTSWEIMAKYLWFALGAAFVGTLIGTILAFAGLPSFIIVIFHMMYALPDYQLCFLPGKALLGAGLFCVSIGAAAVISCQKVLKETPAALMRPKAPKAGSKVLLERITPVWKRLSFLNKVTTRNIFRYKGRMLMTVIGIAGSMAILMFGFAIRDSVHDLNGRQYGDLFHYNIMAVTTPDHASQLKETLTSSQVKSALEIETQQVTLRHHGTNISAALMVIPDDADVDRYISLKDIHGKVLPLKEGDVYVTRNASIVLGFQNNSRISLTQSDLSQTKLKVTSVVENYLGNDVYMRAFTYQKLMGEYRPNGALVILNPQVNERKFADDLKTDEDMLAVTSAKKITEDFTGAYLLIDVVVYVIVAMSAALAFTVLFTLSTTNISERERELATIKVLGFYDHEVHAYVNKETWILTILGVLAGFPLGYAFARTLTTVLTLPSMYLAVSLHLSSDFICAALTLVFAGIVLKIMNRTMDRIDPVTALKSVE